LPLVVRGVGAVAGGARDAVGAANDRRQRDARPRHHRLFHEADDLLLVTLDPARHDCVIGRVVDGRAHLSVQTDRDKDQGHQDGGDAEHQVVGLDRTLWWLPQQR
jgi:hypothetical protein